MTPHRMPEGHPATSPLVRGIGIVGLWLLLAVILGYRMGESGLAAPFSDPLSHIRSQDETSYASSAASIATGGDWITPKVLGRYMLMKPPLLVWLAGLSMKLLGISAFALRLPVVLIASGATILLFLWRCRTNSLWVGGLTVFCLISNPLWHVFARLCYTDMLVTASIITALFAAARDPFLTRRVTIIIIGSAIGAGVMSKNIAGLLSVPILLGSFLLSRHRIPWAAMLKICAIAGLIAAPWHACQLLTHRQWFWADYVNTQLFEFGRNPPDQHSSDPPAWFYLKRLVVTDPVLCLLAVIAIPSFWRSLRTGKTEAALLVCWLATIATAVCFFAYRNLPYGLGLIPPLGLLATGYGPMATAKVKAPLASAAVALFIFKVAFGLQPWGLPYSKEPPIPAEHWLQWYSQLGRPNELIAVNSDDEFYAMDLPMKVRYCFIDSAGTAVRYAPHYARLGITVTEAQFLQLPQLEPEFRARMHEWGLNPGSGPDDPLATSIVAGSAAEFAEIVKKHPASDFYIPAALMDQIGSAAAMTHQVVPATADRVFLMAAGPSAFPSHPSLRATAPRKW